MQQRSGPALPAGQGRVHQEWQAGEDYARPYVVARQRLSPAESTSVAAGEALQPGLGALPGPVQVARLGSPAVLEFPSLSRLRRRPGDRPVHALDRRRPHVYGPGQSDLPPQAAGGVYNYKDGRTAPDTINVLLEYPKEWTATFRSHTGGRVSRAPAVEMCGTEGKLWIDRSRFEFSRRSATPSGRRLSRRATKPSITWRTSWTACERANAPMAMYRLATARRWLPTSATLPTCKNDGYGSTRTAKRYFLYRCLT